MEDYNLITLKNGIRVAHKEVSNTKVAHCGFTLDIGSRDEEPNEQGLAHFWEHMAFKGTQKRKAYHIINRLEVVGGELNAYTTKEKICFYASILDSHFAKAVELLKDITFHSTFPEKEIEKEKSVILEEMSMYLDSPDDAIQDDFDQLIFNGHALGNNILGTADTVRSFHQHDFQEFIRRNLDSNKIIFHSIGNIPFAKVRKILEANLSELPVYTSSVKRKPFKGHAASNANKTRVLAQAHCMIGGTAYPVYDDKRLPFFMLVNLLGGPAMNSRLNMALREKHGFVYSIDAQYASFTDTGLFSIYFGTEKKQLNKSISLVMKELKRLKEVPLTTNQLHTCKEQLMGQLAMAEESNINFMQMMGRSLLDLGNIDSLNDIFTRVQMVSSKELMDLANEMFDEGRLSTLSYIPE